MDKNLLDVQYLDNKFDRYYLITWPECQQFDEVESDDIIPIVLPGTTTPASFVPIDLIEQLREEQNVIYYQPEFYHDDGTNIEYGGIPEGLLSFQVFSSVEKCRGWLKEHGYDPGDFAIIKYSNDDIEDYEIIE